MNKKELRDSFDEMVNGFTFKKMLEWRDKYLADDRVKVDEITKNDILDRWSRGHSLADIASEFKLSAAWIRKVVGGGRNKITFDNGEEIHPMTGKRLVGGKYSGK